MRDNFKLKGKFVIVGGKVSYWGVVFMVLYEVRVYGVYFVMFMI